MSPHSMPILFIFSNKKEIACHSLLFHYKGEGFTCDLSAREPLVRSRMENLKWSPEYHAGVGHSCHVSLPSVLLTLNEDALSL